MIVRPGPSEKPPAYLPQGGKAGASCRAELLPHYYLHCATRRALNDVPQGLNGVMQQVMA